MWFLNLLNPVGKVIDLVNNYLNKKQDVDLEKYRVKGNVDIKAIDADVAIIQARAKLAEATKDDPVTQVAKGWILIPGSIYFGLCFYYYSFANLLPSFMIWKPLELPSSLDYVVYALIGTLLVTNLRK